MKEKQQNNNNMGQGNPNPVCSFPKGVSGNPKGRPPKSWSWAELYEDAVEELDEKGIPIKKTISRKLASLAARGDVSAIKELTNRTDGMPVAKVEQNINLKTLKDIEDSTKDILTGTTDDQ